MAPFFKQNSPYPLGQDGAQVARRMQNAFRAGRGCVREVSCWMKAMMGAGKDGDDQKNC
jgi:hypothetical protein